MYWLIKTINTPFKLHVALSHIRYALSLIRDDVSSKQEIKQASKKTDFTVDLLWWGSLRLAPISAIHIRGISRPSIPGHLPRHKLLYLHHKQHKTVTKYSHGSWCFESMHFPIRATIKPRTKYVAK